MNDQPVSTSQQTESSAHRSGRPTLTALAFVVVFAACGGAYYAGTLKQTTKTSSTSTAATSEDIKTQLFLAYEDGGMIQGKNANLAMKLPTEWRTQGPSSYNCNEDLNYAKVYDCGTYNISNVIGSPKKISGDNSVKLYNLYNWLSTDSADDPQSMTPFFARLQKSTDKYKAWNNLVGLNANSKLTADMVANYDLFNPFVVAAAFVGTTIPKFIQTADGSLRGYSLVTSICQSDCYSPKTLVVMGGFIDGMPVLVTGEFFLNDSKTAELAKLTPGGDQWSQITQDYGSNKNFVYPADTLDLHKEVLKSLKTISIK
jgi:acyl-CoA-binding protein